jgi:predicted peroxiredoxin
LTKNRVAICLPDKYDNFYKEEGGMIRHITLTSILAAFVFLPLAAMANDHDRMVENVFIILSSESPQTQGMALVLANTMVDEGAAVEVLLCDAAGDLALAQGNGGPQLAPKGVTPGKLLGALRGKGASVSVCALYLPNSNYTEEDLAEGVSVAKPPQITALMRDPQVRVFTF